MDLIRKLVFKRRIRISEFFQDYDQLRTGFVTKDQFHRCVSSLYVGIPLDKIKNVINEYFDEKKQKVNYIRFTKDVNVVFVTHDLEKNPLKDEVSPSKILEEGASRIPNTEDIEEIREILSRVRFQCYKRGFRIRQSFCDFDIHNVGIVTAMQFRRGMPFRNLTISELDLLVKRYSTDENQIYVNYMRFNDEVEKGIHGTSKTIEGKMISKKPEDDVPFLVEDVEKSENMRIPTTLEGVVAKLKRLIYQHRIRIEEPFRDFDPLRKGYVTPNQFQSVFGMIKFPKERFSKEEIEHLTRKYQVDKLRLDYRSFLNEMESLFFFHGMEKQPGAQYETPNIPKTERFLYGESVKKFSLSEEERRELDDVEDEIRARVKSERILLKQLFLDFDRASKGTRSKYISYARFCRVLASLGFKLPHHQFELLCRSYDDIHSGTEVNYVNFIENVNYEVSNELIQ